MRGKTEEFRTDPQIWKRKYSSKQKRDKDYEIGFGGLTAWPPAHQTDWLQTPLTCWQEQGIWYVQQK